MQVYPKNLFNDIDLSLASTTSEVCDLNHMYGYSIQAVFTGTATGNIQVQACCDPAEFNQTFRLTNWTTIATLPIAAPGTVIYNSDAAYYRWLRIVYVSTGGTGAMDANINLKG